MADPERRENPERSAPHLQLRGDRRPGGRMAIAAAAAGAARFGCCLLSRGNLRRPPTHSQVSAGSPAAQGVQRGAVKVDQQGLAARVLLWMSAQLKHRLMMWNGRRMLTSFCRRRRKRPMPMMCGRCAFS